VPGPFKQEDDQKQPKNIHTPAGEAPAVRGDESQVQYDEQRDDDQPPAVRREVGEEGVLLRHEGIGDLLISPQTSCGAVGKSV
jgi:hypothetical protein